jgi:hypothetical protein
MFDDLIDPNPPLPGLDTLASVSERARSLRRRRDTTRVLGLGTVAGLLIGSLAFVVDGDPDQQSEIAGSLDAGEQAVGDVGALLNPTESTGTVVSEPVPTNTNAATESSDLTTDSTPVVTTTTAVPLPFEPVPYLAVGDSVMLGAAPALSQRGLFIDAAVSRQMIDMIPVFQQLRDRGLLGDAVVVHLGTNGPISQETLDAFLATMDGVPNVILMTVRADRSWTADNNALLRAADHDGDNKILLDWEVRSAECPGDCFYDDGIHLRPAGQQYYADLISDILGI